MSAKHDDGGPAFPMPSGPEPRVNEATHFNEGMTLWDFYAAAALQGVLARDASDASFASTVSVAQDNGLSRTNAVAMIAAEHADALLAERRKRGIGS